MELSGKTLKGEYPYDELAKDYLGLIVPSAKDLAEDTTKKACYMAYIAWKTYCVLLDYDIEDYYELIGDMISDLSFNLLQHPDMFTNEEKMRYAEFIEE